ncbi:hypothetical protein F5J12DRAFT_293800 [Pisolithus orientalis]|uniref:uncharacterized protein n=1 Tax=Pisolithus orientalis TaxID=936130 RepID=UPI0022249FC2|nr:uncharacterized protein F5J12DRAFT_359686 [Pisolithus orientalis]XP_051604055.1 uncharacterized protein F5J12DRAFT_293800 [Pisolithus orientalis]KAI5996533.1 hypothetical protein F5J12DRAFT_359686 [Pisolithus orientalis]KAI6030468.1 hypothetical protein F5J12DRAFT_293800 [Pisolithus orientalis]
MYLLRSLFSRSSDLLASEQCKLVSSTVPVCVKDLVVVAGCLIVFCLFAFWIVPRVWRKRCRSTCTDRRQAHDRFHVVSPMNDSLLVKHGIVPSLSKPKEVRTTGVSRMSTAYYSESTPDFKYSSDFIGDSAFNGDPPSYTIPSFHPKISSRHSNCACQAPLLTNNVYDTCGHRGELQEML